MDTQWHHICLVWDGTTGSGFTRYYKDGAEVKYKVCSEGTRDAGGALTLGGGGRAENVDITGFNLWNRMLAETEIAEEANMCDGGVGGPIVRWRDFYKKSLRSFIRAVSQCQVSGGKYSSIIKRVNMANNSF